VYAAEAVQLEVAYAPRMPSTDQQRITAAAVEALSKLLREGLAAGLAAEGEPLSGALANRIAAGRAWLQRAHAALTALQVRARACAPSTAAVGATLRT